MSSSIKSSARINRRRFLKTIAVVSAGLLTACASAEQSGAPAPFRTPTTARALASPVVPVTGGQGEAGAATQPVQSGSANEIMTLEQFMQFSSLLTGVDNLNPELGKVYLQALQSGASGGSALLGAYTAASSGSNTLPEDAEMLAQSGFFEQEGMSELAVQIADMWYSGVYQTNGEGQVATYVDALAWKVLHFTKAPTICGAFAFWATEPDVQLSPTVEYTPAPTPEGEGG